MAGAFLNRESYRARISAQKAQSYTQSGQALIVALSANDQSLVTVTFTNPFVELPTFTFGSELALYQPTVQGSFQVATPNSYPTCSATVHQWITTTNGAQVSYFGAVLGVVTSGTSTQQLALHYSFQGRVLNFTADAQASGMAFS